LAQHLPCGRQSPKSHLMVTVFTKMSRPSWSHSDPRKRSFSRTAAALDFQHAVRLRPGRSCPATPGRCPPPPRTVAWYRAAFFYVTYVEHKADSSAGYVLLRVSFLTGNGVSATPVRITTNIIYSCRVDSAFFTPIGGRFHPAYGSPTTGVSIQCGQRLLCLGPRNMRRPCHLPFSIQFIRELIPRTRE